MKTKVSEYRGIDIYFEDSTGKFQTIVTDEESKESRSYNAVKKFIDDYVKNNATFTPFRIIRKLSERNSWSSDKNEGIVTGIRKDQRLVVDFGKGDEQLSDYDMRHYILYNDRLDSIVEEYEQEKKRFGELREKYNKRKTDIESVFNEISGKSLEEFRDEFLQEHKEYFND